MKRGQIPFGLSLELLKEFDLVKQIISYKTGYLSKVQLFDIFCVTEQIVGKSRLVFEEDINGYFQGRCEWEVSNADQEMLRRTLIKFVDWIDQLNVSSKVTVSPENIRWTDRATSAAHHIGTTPMATKVEYGCVDKNCSVYDLDNKVYIADASVMPSAGCANVTLTAMAIAMRTGEHVGKTI